MDSVTYAQAQKLLENMKLILPVIEDLAKRLENFKDTEFSLTESAIEIKSSTDELSRKLKDTIQEAVREEVKRFITEFISQNKDIQVQTERNTKALQSAIQSQQKLKALKFKSCILTSISCFVLGIEVSLHYEDIFQTITKFF